MASAGALDDEVCHLNQVAQLEQIPTHMKMRIELLDFSLQQGNAVGRAFQAFVGANNANVIPHKASQLIPVVGNHDRLIGIGDAAVIPGRKCEQGCRFAQSNVVAGGTGKDHALHQRVTGQSVGAMQAAASGLADGVQAGNVGATMQVCDHAATGVMGCRHHGNGLAADVNAQLQAAGVDVGEMLLDKNQGLVRDV